MSDSYTLCPRVGGCPRFWTSSSNVEQHDRTPSFRQKSADKQGSVLRGHRGSNWDANAVQISQELGFRGDVGLTSRSAARQPQNVALPVRIQHLEAVIKAATKQGAFDWARQGVSARQEIAHGFRGCGRVANTQRSGGSSCHRIPAVRILLRECGLPDHSEFVLETGPDPRLDGRNLTGITITPPTV
jgi:hypothetical protein